ncbi:MAG: hypothetical protein ACFFEN_15755 [Candidatus Thorarchaeota archaeon]
MASLSADMNHDAEIYILITCFFPFYGGIYINGSCESNILSGNLIKNFQNYGINIASFKSKKLQKSKESRVYGKRRD